MRVCKRVGKTARLILSQLAYELVLVDAGGEEFDDREVPPGTLQRRPRRPVVERALHFHMLAPVRLRGRVAGALKRARGRPRVVPRPLPRACASPRPPTHTMTVGTNMGCAGHPDTPWNSTEGLRAKRARDLLKLRHEALFLHLRPRLDMTVR